MGRSSTSVNLIILQGRGVDAVGSSASIRVGTKPDYRGAALPTFRTALPNCLTDVRVALKPKQSCSTSIHLRITAAFRRPTGLVGGDYCGQLRVDVEFQKNRPDVVSDRGRRHEELTRDLHRRRSI